MIVAKIKNKIKGVVRFFKGEFFVQGKIKSNFRIVQKGTKYGGWSFIDININKDSVVYSFGVGEDVSFDMGLIEKYGVKVFAFDPTPKSINWVKSQNLPPNFIMHEYGIADFDGKVLFNPPVNPEHVSHTILDRPETSDRAIKVSVKKLSTIMSELGHSKIDLLKMDIEGAEYSVIEDICRSEIRPNQILVEFHHRFQGIGVKTTKNAIKKLEKMGYSLFYVSESKEEFSFIRRELVGEKND